MRISFSIYAKAVLLGMSALRCATPVSSSAEDGIQITAQITQSNLVKLGAGPDHWTFPVTCSVWSNGWKIDSRFTSNGLESAFFDGTNVYRSLQAVSLEGVRTDGTSGSITITISPSPGGNPLGDLGLNLPWLAFCSGGYLKIPHRIVPLPVVDIPGTADSLSYTDNITTFGDEGGLPKMVELFTSKAGYLRSLSDPRLNRNPHWRDLQLSRKYNYADGLLRFRYVADAFTNYGGRIFPTEFRYFDYRSIRNSDTGLSLVAEGTGTVTSMRPAGGQRNVFSTNATQTVIDCRFRQQNKLLDAISYVWPTAEVPPTNNPTVWQRLEDSIQKAPTIDHPDRAP